MRAHTLTHTLILILSPSPFHPAPGNLGAPCQIWPKTLTTGLAETLETQMSFRPEELKTIFKRKYSPTVRKKDILPERIN